MRKKCCTFNGNLHCENGPAIGYANGNKSWYYNGKLHRANGPAIGYANGDKSWYYNGKLHRANGPAIINDNIIKYWFYGIHLATDSFICKVFYKFSELIEPAQKNKS